MNTRTSDLRLMVSLAVASGIAAIGCGQPYVEQDGPLGSNSSDLTESSSKEPSDGNRQTRAGDHAKAKQCEKDLGELLEREADVKSECAPQSTGTSDAEREGDLREIADREADLGERCHAFEQLVGPTGGTVVASNGTQVVIPAGALAHATLITIAIEGQAAPLPQAQPVGPMLRLGPEGQQFSLPISVVLPFDVADLAPGTTQQDIAVYTAPAGSNAYLAIPTSVTDSAHVAGQTTHFSDVAAGVPGKPCVWDCTGGSGTFPCECMLPSCDPQPPVACVEGLTGGSQCHGTCTLRCSAGQTSCGGGCVSCPTGKTPNPTTCACECNSLTCAAVTTPFVWVGTDGAVGGELAQVSTATGTITTFMPGPGLAAAVDPNGNVWLSDAWNFALHQVTPSGAVTTYALSGGEPLGLAADGEGNLYLGEGSGGGVVRKIDGATGSVVWTSSALCGPSSGADEWGVAVDATGGVWVSCEGANSVSKLNAADGSLVGTYTVGADPFGVAVDGSGNVWVANQAVYPNSGTPSVTKLDGSSGATIGTYPVPANPNAVAIDASGNVWVTAASVATGAGDEIIKLSGTDGSVLGVFAVSTPYTSTNMGGIAADASGHVWAIAHDSTDAKTDMLVELNVADLSMVGTFDTGVHTSGWMGDFTGFALQSFVMKR